MSEPVIITNPEILGGEPVFRGTRAPARALLDYLTTGETVDAFLDQYPTVTREQVTAFLEYAVTLPCPSGDPRRTIPHHRAGKPVRSLLRSSNYRAHNSRRTPETCPC